MLYFQVNNSQDSQEFLQASRADGCSVLQRLCDGGLPEERKKPRPYRAEAFRLSLLKQNQCSKPS
jgi:hypothetical protein